MSRFQDRASLFITFALCRGLLRIGLGARFSRSLFVDGLRGLVVAIHRRCDDRLLALRARSDGRFVIVGQDLGDAQHRDLVAITALAARILAAALLERDDLRAALVLQHFGGNRSTGYRRNAQHRRFAANQENFAKLHDRTDIAGDLAYLEHIIRYDAVLPAAGFDDCEHRLIPSCSIPASDMSGPAFSSVVMDSPRRSWIVANFRTIGKTSLKVARKQTARENPAPDGRTYSPG